MFQTSSKYITASLKKEDSEMDSLMLGAKDEENIALLNNDEVNQYINYVYDMYKIQDPLG